MKKFSSQKLVIITDNTDKVLIRYLGKNDQIWRNLYLKGSDIDSIVEEVTGHLKATYENEEGTT